MSSSVTFPTWFAIVVVGLAGLALLDRIFIPSFRWMMRRRINRAIDQLNTRLKLRIQPFKLTKRQVLIDRILHDPTVIKAVEDAADEDGVPREVKMQRARSYAREIVPSFNAYAYFRIGAKLARRVSQALYRVRLGFMDDDALSNVDPDSTVVFVVNHRSNMDYVLVTYLVSSNSALSYAVGEWARVWVLQGLIKSMGAYFVRRNSRDPFYRKILARYVHMATEGGVTQAMFPEGGLSTDGKLRPPKLGLLSYMVGEFDPRGPRDVLFIPVGINYDRVLEDRMLTGVAAKLEQDPTTKARYPVRHTILLKFLAKSLWQVVRGRWYRYGYACVSFGAPVSLRDYVARENFDFRTLDDDARFDQTKRLGEHLMDRVAKVVPALSVSLVAAALLGAGGAPLSEFEVKGRVHQLMEQIKAGGGHIHIPRSDMAYAIEVGLRMLTLRHLVVEENGTYSIVPAEERLLRYYANAIGDVE